MMPIKIKAVEGKKELRTFIFLPAKIHKDRELWVPPIYADEWAYFNPRKNTSFDFSETVLFLAWRGDEPVPAEDRATLRSGRRCGAV